MITYSENHISKTKRHFITYQSVGVLTERHRESVLGLLGMGFQVTWLTYNRLTVTLVRDAGSPSVNSQSRTWEGPREEMSVLTEAAWMFGQMRLGVDDQVFEAYTKAVVDNPVVKATILTLEGVTDELDFKAGLELNDRDLVAAIALSKETGLRLHQVIAQLAA